MAFQPKINLATGAIASYEALLRWHDPNGAILPPELVIRATEAAGAVAEVRLTEAIVRYICRSISALPEKDRLPVAFNIGPHQVGWALADLIHREARSADIDYSLIEVEVTEHSPIGCLDNFRGRLDELRAAGFRVWFDDFGVGHSTLANLASLKAYGIKLDRFFVSHIETHEGRVLVRSIIRMCKAMGIKVVVEGVETPEQHSFVVCSKADFAQGYIYHRGVIGGFSSANIPANCGHFDYCRGIVCDDRCGGRYAAGDTSVIENSTGCPGSRSAAA